MANTQFSGAKRQWLKAAFLLAVVVVSLLWITGNPVLLRPSDFSDLVEIACRRHSETVWIRLHGAESGRQMRCDDALKLDPRSVLKADAVVWRGGWPLETTISCEFVSTYSQPVECFRSTDGP